MSKSSVKLSAKWQLDAALLSRPVDLTNLVSMSRSSPLKFIEDDTLRRLVSLLLNEKNSNKSDKDTKLDVLNILANVTIGSKEATVEVRATLQGISEWFDEYIIAEESNPDAEPELHKAMVLLLARCWDYKLKTEDVLELTQGNRRIALCTVVGLLEDGETYSTELKQRQKPSQGKMGQWEHELVCNRYEKPLLLQICRLLRGFTHPGTYFEYNTEELTLYSVDKFAEEMDKLLEITLRSRLVEKLSVALYNCLFELEDQIMEQQVDGGIKEEDMNYNILEENDHLAVASVHAFLHNLYFYASENNEEFRKHMLMDTSLIPRLVLPYLERCVLHATILNSRAEAYSDMLEGDRIAEMALHNPQLVKGIAASLRTLIIASFRAPSTQFIVTLLRSLNPTAQMLRASAFCKYHEYIFALLCLLNVNMGALDLSNSGSTGGQDTNMSLDFQYAHVLLEDLATIYSEMDTEKQARVYKRVMYSGALPIARDTPSYAAVMSVLHGGSVGQFDYLDSSEGIINDLNSTMRDGSKEEEEQHVRDARAEIKSKASSAPSSAYKSDDSSSDINYLDSKQSESKSVTVSSNGSSSNTDFKDFKSSSNSVSTNEGGLRLLGDLPSLNINYNKDKVKIALSLELPNESRSSVGTNSAIAASAKPSTHVAKNKTGDSSIPSEFICCINGHVMKDPVRVGMSDVVFERSTIELWLETRGCICPITNEPLYKVDLVADDDLRNKIKRYHIQQTSLRVAQPEDDLYDF